MRGDRAGYELIDGPGGRIEHDTVQCGHCLKHWRVIPGSGRQRGICRVCMSVVCGNPACLATCEPWEKRLEASIQRQKLFAAAGL